MLEDRWAGALECVTFGVIITGSQLKALRVACKKRTDINYYHGCTSFVVFFFFLSESVRDTRSAWKYCNTRATLGRGAAQALQDPNHGLNNSLKLM